MGMFDKILSVATGGLGATILEGMKTYFPPNMSEEQKANIALAAQNIELQRAIQVQAAQQEAEKNLNDRIAMYEGSAADLKAVPFLGAFMLFLRGSQRPVWGFATIALDYGVFSGTWKLTDPIVSNAFWIINFLVLGFLFGERAIMNVMPFFTEMMKAKTKNELAKKL